jgi:diguanylate cyclase (GGDEF)-like protein
LLVVKVASFAVIAAVYRNLPDSLAAALLASSIAAGLLATRTARFEVAETATIPRRFAALVAEWAVPMALFGASLARWSIAEDGIASTAAVAAISVILLATSIIAGKRTATLLASQAGVWAGFFCVANGWAGVLALALGLPLAGAVFVRQVQSERMAAELAAAAGRAQTRAEEILIDYEETGQGWFWETDRRGMLTYLSRPTADVMGSTVEDLIGRPLTALFDQAPQSSDGERTLSFALSARSSFNELGMRAASCDDVERWWSVSGRPVYDEFRNFQGFRGSGTDLTEKRRSQEHASRLAHYDSLTGLSNRFQQSQTLEKILNAPQIQHRNCAVLLLDLDRFKQVNDTLGHPAGDSLLKQVAQRLERSIGSAGRVGRLGGDEFQVILPGRLERDQLANVVGQAIEALSQPYSIDGSRVSIGASVGIAIAPDDGLTSDALIRNADLALYAAKDAGRGRFQFYSADLHSDAEERRQLEQDLRDAISGGGLELYYQPVVQTSTEQITGFEALLRWHHPVRGPISPAKFIPLAEDTGLIAPIGEWALRTACHDLAQWPETVRVAVNVSPLQFANPALPTIVTQALAQAEVQPHRLELEITESVFLNDDEQTDAMFRSLKAVGVRMALDDFGTGYSSLGYLKKAPFDKIKIDQSFVRGATIEGSRNGAIIAAIVSLAEALGMETTAEGVETLDELDLVRALGCSHVQGYIYERPLTKASATARLQRGIHAIAMGPRSARALRQSMLRKVQVEHGEHFYMATIRNISRTGALVEGLWNVPQNTIFRIRLSEHQVLTATARWSQEDRVGVEFSSPLELDERGTTAVAGPLGANADWQTISRKVG